MYLTGFKTVQAIIQISVTTALTSLAKQRGLKS